MSTSEHYTVLVPDTPFYALGLTASEIAVHNFDWRFITFVFFNSTVAWHGIEIFLQSYRKSTIVGMGTFYPKFADTTRQYVLFELSISGLIFTLNWMQNHEFDNTGKFIIVCESQDANECDEMEAVKMLWQYKITNVVFLKNEQEVVGYTYFPFKDSDCRTDVPVKLDDLGSCSNESDEIGRMFPAKFTNMNLCPLVASSFILPPYMKIADGVPSGANGDLLVILAEALNASLEVMTPRIGNGWGKLDENGTWSGSLADVYNDYANFSMTSGALTLSRFTYFQMSKDYNMAGVVWVTHPAKKIPSSLKLTHPFGPIARLVLGMCFLVVVICSLISRSRLWYFYFSKISTDRPRVSVFFYSWMICMGLPTNRMPTKSALVCVVYLWVWFCVLIRTFYQVSLITVLKANYYFGEFETIDDAITAGYPFGGGAALKDYYIEDPIVYDKWIEIETNDIIPTMRNVSTGVEFVLAMSMETAHTIILEEKLHVHMLPQKIVSCPTVLFFKKFSPLVDSIDYILTKLVESGLSDYFKYKYAHSTKLYKGDENTLEPINLDHYTGCYMILITGWIISFILFVGEILFDRINKHNSIKNKQLCKKVRKRHVDEHTGFPVFCM